MSKFSYYTPVEKLTKADVFKENVKAILLSVVIGLSIAVVLFYQLSK